MSQSNKTATKKAQQQADGIRRKEPKRNRSIKRRPDTVPGLIVALKEDTIDLRTRAAQDVLALRDALAQDPEPVVKGLIRDALAIDGVLMSRIAAELVKPGGTILDAKGELPDLITRHWPDVRDSVLKSARALLAVEKATAPGKGRADAQGQDQSEPAPLDVSALVLELSESSNK